MSTIRTRELKQWTMACWWPSRVNGRTQPDWPGIIGELRNSAYEALNFRDDPAEADMFLRMARSAEYERDCAAKTEGRWTSEVAA